MGKTTIEELRKRFEESREIRRREADWDFINKQPPRIRAALIYYIESGDLYVASRIAGISMEEMNDLRVKARIPNTN
ncbi:MAG: hypothetical protein RQ855_05875 [Desulfurococcales archaeon]|jgi:hypothetical protein|nr:hypothetical protein [Desulfurococcales archaeon]